MKKHTPPRWADRFLEWYCRPELLEEIQGDAYELFEKRSREKSYKAARWHFVWDVLRSFRLSTIKNINLKLSPIMLKNNFTIAWRQLLRQKLYSIIKIGGFAIGIAACLLIALFIRDELSYDRSYPNANRIYRVVGVNKQGDNSMKGVDFPAPFAQALKDGFPEIEEVGRLNPNTLFTGGGNSIRREGEVQNNYEEGFTFADQEILDILQVPMVYGDRKTALAEPNTIVISKSKADKYFPNENPVGKTLIPNDKEDKPVKIGGVIEDFPSTSHLDFDFLITMEGLEFYEGEQENWGASNYHTYLLLHPDADTKQLEQKMYTYVFDEFLIPGFKERGMNGEAIEELKQSLALELQPIQDVHLHSADIHDGMSHSDIRFVWLFGAIAVFILLIACINFINLSTARSANRAKEVGLRKTLGSFRTHLINQFLTESVLFSLISFMLGVVLAWLLLPFFNQLADKSLTLPWQEWWFIPLLASATLFIGILAGIYPSFYLSSFKPVNVLSGNLSRGSKGSRLRSALVVFQFTTSIVLIVGTLIIHRQMEFILNKKIGFDKEQVLLVQGTQTIGNQILSFKNELLQLPDVQNVAVSDFLPITGAGTKRDGNTFNEVGKDRNETSTAAQKWEVDHDYVKTMGMNIVEGRDFSIEMPTDSQAAIINQTMARKLNLDDPLGKRITNGWQTFSVIGVVEDFNFESMREDVRAVCLIIGSSPSIMAIKVSTNDMPQLLQSVKDTWGNFAPNQPIRYTFLDDSFATMYADVQRMGRIFSSFAILAIIVACLGLFALSAFMAEQRSKEMSIRKVLGAPTTSILRLLTQNFLILILVSLVIAVPLGWYLMRQWLQDFAYRIDISWDVFILAGLVAIVIALVTISYQAIRTALMNPMDSLRNE